MDLFYYGSQDTPLRPRGSGDESGWPSRSGEPHICESCSTQVLSREIESGRASELFGLVLARAAASEPFPYHRLIAESVG